MNNDIGVGAHINTTYNSGENIAESPIRLDVSKSKLALIIGGLTAVAGLSYYLKAKSTVRDIKFFKKLLS